MSQVIRKFANSGKIEQNKPELFERHGVGKYNKADLVSGLYRNIDTYIKNNNLSGDRAISFRNSANQFIKGIENGTITMNGDGTFSDSSGQMSSTGKFDKNWIGRKKDTANNAFNLVGDYALDYINQMPQYSEPAPTSKSKFNANEFLTKEISKKWYGGNDIDFNNWFKNRAENDRNALLGEIFNNADYNKLYQDYDWTDTGITSAEDLANKFKGFGSTIVNNKLDNDDYNRFAELGGSGLDKFMKETKEVQEPTTEQSKLKTWEDEARAAGATSPEAISAYVQGKQREEADRNAAIIKANEQDIYNRERDKYFEDFISQNPFKGTVSGYVASKTTYNPERMLQRIDDNYAGNINKYLTAALDPRYFRGQLTHSNSQGQDNLREHLANNLDLAINTGKLPKIDDETYAIPGTYNYDNWSLVTYNPTIRQYKETSMLANDALKKIAYAEYDRRKKVPSNKEGGIIKLQYGGFVEDDSAYNAYKEQFAKKKEEQVKQRAQVKGRTVEEQKVADRKPGSITSGNWTGEDYTRLASIVADIGSMGAAYVPVYGTAASAVLGAGSSVANYGADLSENGFRWRDLGNLAVNLGLDAVGLVPGLGSAAKGSKILKTAAKYLPRVLATVSLANTPEVYQSVKKAMTPGTDLTVDDWRNIAEGFKMVLQGGKGIKRTVQAHNLKKELATGNSLLTTLGGKEVSVTPAQLSEIRSHRKLEDQEAALQLLLKDDNLKLAGDLNKRWFNPTGWLPNSNIRKEYDFNKTKKVRTSKGEIEVPIVHSNSDKYIAATMQQNFIKIPGADDLAIKYNDWKYGVNKGNKKPTKKQETPKPKKELLALPTPNQVHRTPSREYINVDISKDLGRSNLTGKGVITSSSPVESPDAGTIRTVNAISSILQPFTNKPKNLPAVIPASRNAEKVVASRTIQPTKRLDQFIEDQIPGGLVYGRARAKKEREYRDIFHPVAEAEYNKVWDEAIKNRKDFGYEEVTPRRNPYVPPTEIYVTPQQPMIDKNARYLWELTNNKKSSTAHVKREELPHKKSNKKKKTSKDNKVKRREFGGLLFKEGGLIPKFKTPAGPVTRIKAKDMSGWDRSKALSGYDWVADFDRWAKGHTGPDDVVDSYITAFNGGEDIYDKLTESTGNYFGGKYNYSVQDPLAKQRQITFRGTNQGFDDLIRNGIIGYGTTEGKTGFDVYSGDRTGNRTLGRGLSAADVTRFNEQLATRGMELYDNGKGGYRLRRLQEPVVNLPEVEIVADKKTTQPTTPSSTITPGAGKTKKPFNFNVMPEDVIALGRMVGGLAANNRASKLYKEGLKPTLLDTFENTVPLQGNFQAKSNAEQQAGNIESVAARPRTSDASLQLAGELEASDKAGQARFQGGLQDAEMFYKTRMLGQQESDAAKARRVEVANKNRASMNRIDAAKKQIDAARVTSNYQQVIAPFLAGVENQFALKRAMNQQLDMESAQKEAERLYSPEFDRLTDDYNTAYKAYGAKNNNNYIGWETSNEYKSLISRRKALNNDVSQFLLDKRKSIMGSPYMFQVGQTSAQKKIPYSKSGSKLTAADRKELQKAKDFNKRLLEDNKQFHKDIMESKREHNKMISSMSSLTAELIKKAMS